MLSGASGCGRGRVAVDRALRGRPRQISARSSLGWLGIGPGRAGVAESVWRVVELVRVPRMLIGGFVGAGLALSGAVLQGVFRNPLVDPHVIGVSSGAAFGGVFAILLGLGAVALWSMAFACGLGALLLVVLLSRKAGRSSILMLVLSGIVVSALFSALVSLATYFADPNDTLPAIVFWLMGSFASATPERALLMLPIIVVFALPLLVMRIPHQHPVARRRRGAGARAERRADALAGARLRHRHHRRQRRQFGHDRLGRAGRPAFRARAGRSGPPSAAAGLGAARRQLSC